MNLCYEATAVVSAAERSRLWQGYSGQVSMSCNTQIQHHVIIITISQVIRH